MRVCIGEPETMAHTGDWRVTLDGVEVAKDCVRADEELGEVELHVRDKYGNFVIDTEKMTCRTEVRKGRVVVSLVSRNE